MNEMEYLLLVLAYLLGSVPFGLLTGRLAKKVDIREHGSKNVGATNVMRIVGPAAAVLVLLLDVGKGVLAVRVPVMLEATPEITVATGVLVVLGHCFPVFLSFKGGKGVATGLGVMLSIPGFQLQFVVILIIAIGLIALTRYVSLGSMTGAVLAPLGLWLFAPDLDGIFILLGAAVAAIIVLRHRENIVRLLRGEESKLGQKVKV